VRDRSLDSRCYIEQMQSNDNRDGRSQYWTSVQLQCFLMYCLTYSYSSRRQIEFVCCSEVLHKLKPLDGIG